MSGNSNSNSGAKSLDLRSLILSLSKDAGMTGNSNGAAKSLDPRLRGDDEQQRS